MSQPEGKAGSSRLKMLIGAISNGEATHVSGGSRKTGEIVQGNIVCVRRWRREAGKAAERESHPDPNSRK